MLLAILLLAASVKAPSNFQAVPSQTSVALSWAFSGSGTGFQLDRQQSGTYQRIAVLPISARTYNDGNLTAGTQYSYRIRAYKNNTFSQYVYVTVTTNPIPIPPLPCGEQVHGIRQLTAAVTPGTARVTGVSFVVGTEVIAVSSTEPFAAWWYTAQQPNGCYQVKAIATDELNQTGESVLLPVEIKN